ncbi:hypothetical protein AK830_g5718 [Neonectria ditissima]|uniref:Uncharacterized protein n=1 Tax=Neonectria ditissima TaxID=78410 RepID=A0A0P7BIG4_9HYPO|nr:hypothetical protein AK830_g5718 [Neonectria ditissima]
MPLFQPTVAPLPPSINLSGKTAIVTGASSGIGLEISRQLLTLKVSNLILAVRNITKGEAVRQSLISDPAVKAANPNANVKVMSLDTENYASARQFASAFTAEFADLHLLMLNAGIGTLGREFASSGHEKNIQVNYLSNVLLTFALLPVLEATADRTGAATRVTWTGSRSYRMTSLASKLPLKQGEAVLKHFDEAKGIPSFVGYGDSKLLVVFFQRELARRYSADKVIVNNFCPGMANTGMSDVLPIYLRIPVNLVKAIRARSPEKAAWIGLNAALVAGTETHGHLLEDVSVDKPSEFVVSEEGQRVQKLLWEETCEEMDGLTPNGPRSMTKKTDWLFKGAGRKLATIQSSEVQPSPTAVTSSGGYNLVCSYNWLETNDPTVYVPGDPPRYVPRILPIQVARDSGRHFIDQNSFRLPQYPFEVVFRAMEVMNPTYKFNDVDVLINRNTLRKLLDFCHQRHHIDFRINLFVVQNTLVVERCEEKPVEMIQGGTSTGFGHNFEQAVTRSLPGMEGIVGYHRVLDYDFGGLKCAVRFEVDAFVDDSSGLDASLASMEAQVGALSLATPTIDLSDTLKSLQIRDPETDTNLTKVQVISRGSFVPHTHAAEIKSIARHKTLGHLLPQLWFGRTQNLIQGHHIEGVFHKITVDNVGQDLRIWEAQLRTQTALRKVAMLLAELRGIVKNSECKACVVVCQKQSLTVFAATQRKTPLPADVTRRFWGMK